MRNRLARRLSVEGLENRQLLAGDVTVTRSGADLYVTGDNLSNTISIQSDGSGGVRVLGFNDASSQATRINGTANGTFQASAFNGSIFVNMNGGDDAVRLTGLQARTVVMNLGAGNDSLVAGIQDTGETRFGPTASSRLNVSESFTIIGADGQDDIRVRSVNVVNSLVIDTGEQDDTVILRPDIDGSSLAAMSGRVDVGGTLTIAPGNGVDRIVAAGVVTGANLVIDDAGGPLSLSMRGFRSNGSTFIYGTPGNDSVSIVDGHAAALMQILTEGGDDVVAVRDSTANNFNTNLADGADRMTLLNVRAPRADVQLGTGNDSVTFNTVDIDVLYAFGNTGDDWFDIRGSTIDQANIFGDSGFDTIQTSLGAPNVIGQLNRYSIERNVVVA